MFVRVTNAWSQQAYIKASNTGMSDAFGGTVTLSGDVLVVAASAEDSNARNVNGLESDNSAEAGGAVYLFRRTGSVWAQVAYIKASNTGGGDYFGSSLSLSGNTLVVGAFLEDGGFGGVNGNQSDNSRGGAGAAYVRRLAP